MIIHCNNCSKNFDIDSSLIPDKGRLLQCSACNHKWFFKKAIADIRVSETKVKDIMKEQKSFKEDSILEESNSPKTIELLDRVNNNSSIVEDVSIKDLIKKHEIKDDDNKPNINTIKKNYSVLSLIVVFIISFIAVIIILDTFQKPINSIVPNIDFFLYSLYETINDIFLFFRDLI
jgi:predicted Zn finger-like uncharacterized protein